MITFAAACLKPNFIPTPKRLRGAKALGIRFEKAVAKALPEALHGQWYEYLQDGKPHWCQPDLVIVGSARIAVIEVKLTDWAAAQTQLALYSQVLALAYGKPVVPLTLLKHLTNVPPEVKIFERVSLALKAEPGLKVVHWLGKGEVR